MDTAWIQVFVLTIAECVAPAGKTVCQEREFELQFVNESECNYALEQLVALKKESESVIVDPAKSSCKPSAIQQTVFASIVDINAAFQEEDGWQAPNVENSTPDLTQAAHSERLANMPACDDVDGVAPCKIGEIIVEGATTKKVEVWRREQ